MQCCCVVRGSTSRLLLHEWESKRPEDNAERTLVLPALKMSKRDRLFKKFPGETTFPINATSAKGPLPTQQLPGQIIAAFV